MNLPQEDLHIIKNSRLNPKIANRIFDMKQRHNNYNSYFGGEMFYIKKGAECYISYDSILKKYTLHIIFPNRKEMNNLNIDQIIKELKEICSTHDLSFTLYNLDGHNTRYSYKEEIFLPTYS